MLVGLLGPVRAPYALSLGLTALVGLLGPVRALYALSLGLSAHLGGGDIFRLMI